MTVPDQVIFNTYTANGVTTVFPYTFKITAAEDLKISVEGIEVTSGFNVSGVGGAGGNVTFAVAPLNTYKVLIELDPILKRTTDYQQFGDWNALNVNNDLDRLWLAMQAKHHGVSRAIKLPVDTTTDQVITQGAADRANKVIGFDAVGDLLLMVLNAGTSLVDLAASAGSALIGFIQSGTGAVARTLQDKTRETVSVVDFFTAAEKADSLLVTPVLNHAASTQKAINYAASIGGEVFFPPGRTYRWASTINPHGVGTPTSGVTLRGVAGLEGGGGKILSTVTPIFAVEAGTYHMFNLRRLSIVSSAASSNFISQMNGSFAWSHIEGCYLQNIVTTQLLLTGAHIFENNFQNSGKVTFLGGDFTVRDNFIGFDQANTTALNSDGFVMLQSANNFSFHGNYITSMSAGNAPIPLRVYLSNVFRIYDNWIDGGKQESLVVENGTFTGTISNNHIAPVYVQSGVAPVRFSNSKHINFVDNHFHMLAANANAYSLESDLDNIIIRDNITAGIFSSYTPHDIYGKNTVFGQQQRVYVDQIDLRKENITTDAYIRECRYGRVITNTGAASPQWLYVHGDHLKAGDKFSLKRTNTGSRTMVHDLKTSTTIFDSDVGVGGFSVIVKFECFADGVLTPIGVA